MSSPALSTRTKISDEHEALRKAISDTFAEPFTWIDTCSGDVVHSDRDTLSCDFYSRLELIAEVYRQGKPAVIEDVSPICMLAIPYKSSQRDSNLVALGIFVTDRVDDMAMLDAAADSLGIAPTRMADWIQKQEIWTQRQVIKAAELVVENNRQKKQLKHLSCEINEAINHARDTYLELGLLHRVAQHLHLSKDETDLWRKSLGWLSEKLSVQCLAIVPNKANFASEKSSDPRKIQLATIRDCKITKEVLQDLMDRFGPGISEKPLMLGTVETALPTWPYPFIKQLISVPVYNGNQLLAWLLAINHSSEEDGQFDSFTSVETRLLTSVATMLGIHSGNIQLYKEQSELIASSVQALTSAIDAKDQYTAGHSDRVAQVSVMLAKQLGMSQEDQETIYLAGLLHDIGKIGIDDQILNKSGKLSKDEFEQVKMHPQYGYEILKGVRQLQHILPMVLHHHEAWNGKGYPHGLKKDEIPLMARIISVADAFDAMSSDRSYRKGMSDEKLDAILMDGANSQWDPAIIDAFFVIRDEVRKVSLKIPSVDSPN